MTYLGDAGDRHEHEGGAGRVLDGIVEEPGGRAGGGQPGVAVHRDGERRVLGWWQSAAAGVGGCCVGGWLSWWWLMKIVKPRPPHPLPAAALVPPRPTLVGG